MTTVQIYSHGPLCCSVCAPKSMSPEDVARETNAQSECGTELGWVISSDTAFQDGTPIPAACEQDSTRQHWLLDA